MVEQTRAFLAKNKQYNLLRKTYNSRFSELKNTNNSDFWDGLIKERADKTNYISKDRIKTIMKMIKLHKGKLLDVGFGRGLLEESINKTSFKLYGIDISKTAIDKMINKEIKGEFIIGSILKIPFDNNFFDFVVALEVLEHISPSDTFQALRELKRVLKERGLLIISVPLNENLEDLHKKGLNFSRHVRNYTPALIEAELKIAGFSIKQKKFLYAFKNFYGFKKFLQKTILKHRWCPNNIVILAQKP